MDRFHVGHYGVHNKKKFLDKKRTYFSKERNFTFGISNCREVNLRPFSIYQNSKLAPRLVGIELNKGMASKLRDE